jgi:hypothetical protein
LIKWTLTIFCGLAIGLAVSLPAVQISPKVEMLSPCTSTAPMEKQLRRTYDLYNGLYFGGKLSDQILIYYGLAEGNTGQTRKSGSTFLIEINPRDNLTERQVDMTMLHEMCHVASWGKDLREHGPSFMYQVRRIMLEGAFDDLL